MAAKKDVQPFTGLKGVEKAIEEGRDPNADMNEVDTSATKAEAGVALRLSGASYTQIAKTLGYSSAYRARAAVERALATSADAPEERDKMRNLTSRRLNRLLQSVMGKAVDPRDTQHLAYNARALAIIDREARLWGVDAPTQVQFTPTDQHIQDYVAKITVLADADRDAEEADIIDADVLEDED